MNSDRSSYVAALARPAPGGVAGAVRPRRPAEGPPAGIVLDFERALIAGLRDDASVSSSDRREDAETAAPAAGGESPGGPAAELDTDLERVLLDGLGDIRSIAPARVAAAEPANAGAPVAAETPDLSAWRDAAAPMPEIPAGPGPGERDPDAIAAALAFATDPETERALREGLFGYRGATPGLDDAQVWWGGLRAAVAALAEGHSSPLVIVDIDGVAFPAGAIHELAEVCEMGTSVIAVGSDDSARLSRELLFAGVSDYLVKPVAPPAIREAAARAASEPDTAAKGCVVGFAGTGGSGTTTLAAAMALHAAERGRYVSALDLSRTVPALALTLDVEPAAGLDQLFETAGGPAPDPDMLEGVRVERSERIAVYAYRWAAFPPPAPRAAALDWLLGELRRRSHLVLVDGLDDPALRQDLLTGIDARVLVAEPTAQGAARAARLLDLHGGAAPVLLVQNHTRKLSRKAGIGSLSNAGIAFPPDATVPFEASLPRFGDRGWPAGSRLPKPLRAPVAGLLDRVLAMAGRPAEFSLDA